MRELEGAKSRATLPLTGALGAWFDRVRLRRWVHLLPLPLATFDATAPPGDAVVGAVRGVANAFAILGFGYLLNSVSDRRTDLDARKNPFIVEGAGEYGYSLAGFLTASVILAAWSPWPAQVATCICLVLGCVYSVGPRLKSVPIAATLVNALGFTPLLFVGMRSAALPPGFGYVVAAFAALLLQNQLIHEAADCIEDSGAGIRTSWTVLGPRRTALIVAGAGAGVVVASAAIAPAGGTAATALAAAAFALLFPLLLVWRGRDPLRAARLRIAHRWCAVLFGALFFAVWRMGIA